MKTPTIKQLVEWNKGALQCLKSLADDNLAQNRGKFMDSADHVITASPIGNPYFVKVSSFEGNISKDQYYEDTYNLSQSRFEERRVRPYKHNQYGLTSTELEMVLGLDYKEGGPSELATTTKQKNTMWEINEECPYQYANAYVFGSHRDVGLSTKHEIVPVQYYCINGNQHRSLRIPQWRIEELTERIRKEAKYNAQLKKELSVYLER